MSDRSADRVLAMLLARYTALFAIRLTVLFVALGLYAKWRAEQWPAAALG